MCISLKRIWIARGAGGEWQEISCGDCWSCRANKVTDFVGRALCEADDATASYMITLTYAPRGDLAEKVITPRHFQDFIRALRKRGHKVRYIGSGEYGERHGRAHFHAVLFFYGSTLDVAEQVNTHIDAWPHGFVYVDSTASDRSIRYVCKYLLKSDKTRRWFTVSKKPLIGWGFLERKAQHLASLGVMPTSFTYMPPNGRDGRVYLLSGASRRKYIERCAELLAVNPSRNSRLNEWVDLALERAQRLTRVRLLEAEFRQVVYHARQTLGEGASLDEIFDFIDLHHEAYAFGVRPNYTDLQIANHDHLTPADDWA